MLGLAACGTEVPGSTLGRKDCAGGGIAIRACWTLQTFCNSSSSSFIVVSTCGTNFRSYKSARSGVILTISALVALIQIQECNGSLVTVSASRTGETISDIVLFERGVVSVDRTRLRIHNLDVTILAIAIVAFRTNMRDRVALKTVIPKLTGHTVRLQGGAFVFIDSASRTHNRSERIGRTVVPFWTLLITGITDSCSCMAEITSFTHTCHFALLTVASSDTRGTLSRFF